MIRKIFSSIFFVLILTLYASAQATKTLVLPKPIPPSPPGNIELLGDYVHIKKQGIDAAVGEISKPDGMTIRYLIGTNAELAVERICYRRNACLWYKKQVINGREVWLGLSKEGQIVATFPREFSKANFYADTKSPEDIADFLIMVMTYKVKESPVQNKVTTQKPKQK